ncbi:MAG: SlyX family protein [Alphaproteobacteria bacterium]|nr:SlyX family protein [Alphaproteobacteria bacterium]
MTEERIAVLERRLEEVEVRYSFQEQALHDLDGVVRELADALERARHELRQVREELRKNPEDANIPEDEVPPHY